MTTSLRDPVLGLVLDGRYRVDAVVARGGMAMVYRATDLAADTEVAVKVMHAHLAGDDTMVERFRREALTAMSLDHDNLVSVTDQGTDGDVVYLVMEYLPSVTLRKELKHRGRLTPRQAIVVMDSVLAGLEAVHAAGLIHRDLKPDNVLLGVGGRIELADFGLARSISNSTTTKTLIGTVGYVAPELVTRAGADARTDLYTLGIMFYEMLTGQQPYTDEVPIQVAYRHVHDEVPAPSDLVPELSPLLDALVLWATSRDPEDRPQTATELRRALAEARAEMSHADLDLSPTGHEPAPAPGTPVITATIPVEDEAHAAEAPADPTPSGRSGTDEIPYLASEEDPATGPDERTGTGTGPEDAAGAGSAAAATTGSAAAASVGSDEAGDTVEVRAGIAGDAAAVGMPATDEHHPRRARKKPLLVLAAAVLTLGLAGWGFSTLGPRTADVPAISAGQELADAESTVESAGLDPVTNEVFDSEIPAGKVVRIEPAAGTELDADSPVTLYVSKGVELFAVPDLGGRTEAEAGQALRENGLVAGAVTEEFSSTVPAGQVIDQSVAAGSEVEANTGVDLTVSKGVETIELPIVTGLDYESAWPKFTKEGLKVAREEESNDSVPAGKVVSQYPAAGEHVEEDTLVILTVSTGPAAAPDSGDGGDPDERPADGSGGA
ncbi:Stk1 family PASTA domain-containing Ser/Thr kinase [Brevibacterium litoralis]|uniref:Stk1 family PASTA domain-containing Ser/Thr kinase n=1 Tax=Brevibacterium litoralis TaxID=3138935 RepID=UPI0032EAE974